jgi:hypothetical protein
MPLKLKPLALIASLASAEKFLYRHLIGKSALKRGIKMGLRKKSREFVVLRLRQRPEAAAKKYCILFIDPKASRSRTCHDFLSRAYN